MLEQLKKADRLKLVAEHVGFALWQLQELEMCAAQCFVLLVQATKGMGEAAGNVLVENAQGKTFGATLKQLEKNAVLPPEVSNRFSTLLQERNWLVHQSRADSRDVIHSDKAVQDLVLRLEAIADEALSLLKEVGVIAERFVMAHGVSKNFIDQESQRMLRRWRQTDE